MLEAKNLTASYGHHRALDGVSAHVDLKEICVVLGANGAGKTTLLKAIGGIVPVNGATEIAMNGRRLNGLKAHEIVEAGIALVPEGRGIFADLTVEENLQLGAYAARARANEKRNREMVFDLFPKLAERRRQQARTMSGGEQQMVAIARALMSDPEILMLDEPSLGLSPLLCTELFRSLKEIGATGVGILLVEQNAKLGLAIADRGYLLENGHITGEDSAANLARDPAVRRAYLGGPAEAPAMPPCPGRRYSEDAMPATRPIARTALRGNESAAELCRLAGDLAGEAEAVLSAHIARRRAEAPPRRAAVSGAAPPDARALAAMAGELATQAAAIHARHIAERRQLPWRARPGAEPVAGGEAPEFGKGKPKKKKKKKSAKAKKAGR